MTLVSELITEARGEFSISGRIYVLFKCHCGNYHIAQKCDIKSGKTKGCGCSSRKHGMKGTKFYEAWSAMHNRCKLDRYVKKNINVCDEWKDFSSFMKDMYSSYSEGLTLDRIDNSRGYYKENCRWADYFVQNNNRDNNHILSVQGYDDTVSNWARLYGLKPNTLNKRINTYKMDADYALLRKVK